jgi:hypothetical protein
MDVPKGVRRSPKVPEKASNAVFSTAIRRSSAESPGLRKWKMTKFAQCRLRAHVVATSASLVIINIISGVFLRFTGAVLVQLAALAVIMKDCD